LAFHLLERRRPHAKLQRTEFGESFLGAAKTPPTGASRALPSTSTRAAWRQADLPRASFRSPTRRPA